MMRNLHCSTGAMMLFIAGLLAPVAALGQGKLVITTSSLPAGTANVAYSQPLAAKGGTPPYQWSLTSSTSAPGLTLSSQGVISGTPTTPGAYSFTVAVSDSKSGIDTASLQLTINSNPVITTTSLSTGTVGAPYSATLAQSGGASPVTWSLSQGILPQGLSLAPTTGVISGTPSAAGTATFTVKVTDSSSATATKDLSIAVDPAPLAITTSSLPAGTVGVAYSQALNAAGGSPPYTWSIATGSLPAGLTLSGNTISGTPTASGPANFTVKVADTAARSTTAALSITINAPPLTITTSTLPAGTVGVTYSQSLNAAGGTPPYTWSIASGSLPAGLTLSGNTISGTPTTAGPSTFTVKVTDSASVSTTAPLSITINAPALTITTSSLPAGTAGVIYSQSLSATGGTPPYTWSIASGSLPAGLTLSGNTISGTPTAAGPSTFTIKVTDSASVSTTAPLSITINAPALTITTSSLPAGTVGAAYSQSLNATGGTPPYTWSLTSGSLPAGLTLTGNTISGTPTAAGPSTFTLKVTDSASVSTTAPLSITINAPALTISTSSLPAGTVGAPYSQPLSATGGTPPYTWSLASGSLPAGLTLSGNTISGTPTAAGPSTFTVKVTDSASASTTAPLSITINAPTLTITTSSLPAGTLGTAYSQTLSATGGTPPYTWSLASGSLPAGLTLSANTISGTPTAAGPSTFTLKVTDSASVSTTAPLSITIKAPALTISSSSLPAGTVGAPYSQPLSATGGTPPYTWSLASGSLPAGLTLSGNTISGTPTAAGPSTFTVKVTDSASLSTTATVSITINAPPLAITTSSLPPGTVGAAYSQLLTATGGTPPYTWSLASGSLPAGLTLSGNTISGTPTAVASASFTVKVTDGASASTTAALSLLINSPALTIDTSSLPHGTVGAAYSQPLNATGGTPPYIWSVATGSLPAGLTLSGNTISGTPTAAGPSSFTINVTDSASVSTTAALSITINAPPLTITTSSLLPGAVGIAYSQTLNATGGTAPYTWSLASGSLPAGLSLAGNTISGTPTASGSSSFTVKLTDATTASATTALSITINGPALTLTAPSLPPGTVGAAYSQALNATGGTPPYTWSVATGSLPAGLTLSGNTISGTPTAAGPSTFTVKVTDSASASATAALTIVINSPALIITTSSLPPGTVGATYSQPLNATGGTPPYTWSVATGSLPAGLMLSGNTISGTPTAPGPSSFTVKLTDGATASATAALTIVINSPALTITTSSLPLGTTGAGYAQPVSATGGTPPYTWSLASGSLPAGLSLSGGIISGTPMVAGSSSFTLRVTDSMSAFATAALSLSINDPALNITITSLPPGSVGTPYSQGLNASGGFPPYTWSIAGGSLPSGLTLARGVISGTPTSTASTVVTIRVTDSTSASATSTFSFVVTPPILTITTLSLPPGAIGIPYSQPLNATGGSPPYTWSLVAGALPPGLGLVNSTVTGTPLSTGSSSFTLKVTDSASASAMIPLSLTINSRLLTITNSPLPAGTIGIGYSQTLVATGGLPPYTWSVAGGSLPDGLSLSPTGTISGTATSVGASKFTVRVTDASSATTTAALSLTIDSSVLTITTSSLPAGAVAAAYSQTLNATGGSPPYTWAIALGALPSGLTLGTTGTISGTPDKLGVSSFTARVTDSAGVQTTKTLSLAILASSLQITTSSLPQSTVGAAYTQTLSAAGGTPPFTWSVTSGSLPPGLTVDPGGTINGTASAAGSFAFAISVSDSTGAIASMSYSLTINAGVSLQTSSVADALIGTTYGQSVQATGGTPPYSWMVTDGALPDGITLDANSGTLIGTPSAAGSFTFTLRAIDSTSAFADGQFQITIAAGLIITTAPSLPPGSVALQYQQTLDAAGGKPPYIWSISSGGLPAGVVLNSSTGELSGLPSVADTFQFTVDVTDALLQKASKQFSLTVATPLLISTAPQLQPATAGTSYSQLLTASGGTPPYLWSITSGGLPPGLAFDPASSTISGVPAQAGSFTFDVQVFDKNSVTVTKEFTIGVTSTLLITTTSAMPDGMAGSPYSVPLGVTGGVAPYAWMVAGGALPPGLTIDPNTNSIVGTPVGVGTFTFTLQVMDSGGGLGSVDCSLNVTLPPAPSVSLDGLPDTLNPADQPLFKVSLPTSYPIQLTGQIAMTFTPDAVNPIDDPSVQFATGGRSVKFTIPAGSTTAMFSAPQMAFQTGTVAGTITLDLSVQPAGGQVIATASRILHINRAAPVTRNVTLVPTPGGFELHITGYSTPRQLTNAVVQLTPAAGSNLQTTQLTIALTNLASTWYQSAASRLFGSQFTLVLPFTIQGTAASIDSVTASLTNDQGNSQPVTLKFNVP